MIIQVADRIQQIALNRAHDLAKLDSWTVTDRYMQQAWREIIMDMQARELLPEDYVITLEEESNADHSEL